MAVDGVRSRHRPNYGCAKLRAYGLSWCKQTCRCGLWLSLVERLVRDEEAVGSNPTSPIIEMCADDGTQPFPTRTIYLYGS